ncbi:hypothetical protein [Alkalihalobacterium chitinilyticum]|uniref:N-acetyltransferase n=1 Tax=Alkalihalobacterium chitinilyticum TaxID=2980103 RepID=A0ABT5VJE9_9BACI|nr:hypothetical protein [Alkalihalobacterium chitinilyticum]MDE5415583.1 hypothetical protein [Alkalihalobacterium chitinilyticum]
MFVRIKLEDFSELSKILNYAGYTEDSVCLYLNYVECKLTIRPGPGRSKRLVVLLECKKSLSKYQLDRLVVILEEVANKKGFQGIEFTERSNEISPSLLQYRGYKYKFGGHINPYLNGRDGTYVLDFL